MIQLWYRYDAAFKTFKIHFKYITSVGVGFATLLKYRCSFGYGTNYGLD